MTFSITANTYTLRNKLDKNDKNTVLRNDRKYIIPVYQRPYSWGEEQVSKLMSDIFAAYEGRNQVFLGTMQISAETNHEVEIIDGQQRLTTLLVLLKVLKCKYPDDETLQETNLDWIETRVNGGKQQELLREFIATEAVQKKLDENYSTYTNNYVQIKNILNEYEENNEVLNIRGFLDHIFSNIYFVVIETSAGLSETLKIFDAINTTGLDLAAGDIFKIRMYEYLKNKNKGDEKFDEINKVYALIDENNNKYKDGKVTDITGVLRIYQYILIARYGLPVELYNYATDTFYERLFETLFNINQWEHFRNNVDRLDLCLDELIEIIKIRYEWEVKWRDGDYGTAENAALLKLWRCSRYGRYWNLIFVFLYQNKSDANRYEKLYEFTKQLVKVYLVYSLYYKRSKNGIKGAFTSNIVNELVNNRYDSAMSVIHNKLQNIKENRESEKINEFKKKISGNIFSTQKMKNILCRLSALFEENHQSTSPDEIKGIVDKLFGRTPEIDIEHIESRHHEDERKREDIWEKWGDDLNSIGNLVVLERDKNRSIKNCDFAKKRGAYEKSSFEIVKNLALQNASWNHEKCEERREKIVNKIMDYLFSQPSIPTREYANEVGKNAVHAGETELA
jgi:hypothetical protein